VSTQATTFDLGRFCRALEERDTETQITMYAPEATVTIADRVTPPGAARVLNGADEIRAWLHDISGREMTHAVQRSVQDEHGGALSEACRYADGTNVLCVTVFGLADGLITEQTVVQAWDES
jgi:hypothetical protein